MVLKSLRRVATGLAIVVIASVASAGTANAAIPTPETKLIWANRSTGYCLGVTAGNVTNETPIIVWQCNNNTDQTWTAVSPVGGGQYWLQNGTNKDKCLAVGDHRKDNGAPLVIRDCRLIIDTQGTGNDEFWTFADGTLPGCTVLVNSNSGKVMGVQAASTKEAAPVVLWDNLHHGDQEWCSSPAPVN